ncbi:unnamed protein product [Pieris brassicae]|uniref:Reverse transcriptase zinc-binding domain-containing protein n=1 Tax=Pieris brassicae TaxID=7116 RepID=A0A9P0TJV6_PIEBR|nr:unnamed protein product [Pieris brassicae]
MTGHGPFASYLNRFNLKRDPSCPCDNTTPETSLHCLLSCPMFGVARHEVGEKTGISLVENQLPQFVSRDDLRTHLEELCNRIIQSVRRRNKDCNTPVHSTEGDVRGTGLSHG